MIPFPPDQIYRFLKGPDASVLLGGKIKLTILNIQQIEKHKWAFRIYSISSFYP